MITLKLKSGEVRIFNLKSFDREEALRDAFKAMAGDPKYAKKRLRITTNEYGVATMKISAIHSCEFDKSVFCVGEVKTS